MLKTGGYTAPPSHSQIPWFSVAVLFGKRIKNETVPFPFYILSAIVFIVYLLLINILDIVIGAPVWTQSLRCRRWHHRYETQVSVQQKEISFRFTKKKFSDGRTQRSHKGLSIIVTPA